MTGHKMTIHVVRKGCRDCRLADHDGAGGCRHPAEHSHQVRLTQWPGEDPPFNCPLRTGSLGVVLENS